MGAIKQQNKGVLEDKKELLKLKWLEQKFKKINLEGEIEEFLYKVL